jgi:hypothetical protein
MSDLAVVVTCRESQLGCLPDVLESVKRQTPEPAERVLVLDGCGQATIDAPWRCISGDWRHPGAARDDGLGVTTAPWVSFWDADMVMADGYVAAMQRAIEAASANVAIIYPDILYCDERMTPMTYWAVPGWDYWKLRAENYVDTTSAWRRDAMDVVGGWPLDTDGLDDYALALRVTAAGWSAVKLAGPPVLMRAHPGRRQREGGLLTDVWRARSLAVVSLLAGRDDTFARWRDFLFEAELPPRTALYVVDNSGRPEFTRTAFETCQAIVQSRRLAHLDFALLGRSYSPAPLEQYFVRERHLHVARLYASVLPRVQEDLVLTLEDDVEPPLDAPRLLGEEIGYRSRGDIGVVAAAYAMPYDTGAVCAGQGDGHVEGWGGAVPWNDLPNEPVDVTAVGGGCTVWANWAIRGQPIHQRWGAQLGWDGVLCLAVRRRGHRVRLHGGVRCQHHVHGNL